MKRIVLIALLTITVVHAGQKPNKQAEQEREQKRRDELMQELRKIDAAREKAGLPPARICWGATMGDNVYLS